MAKNLAQVADEQVACYDLRLTGMTMRAIAHTLQTQDPPIKISTATVERRINSQIAAKVQPAAAALRAIELDRLDLYLTKLNPKIETGDEKSIATALRVGQRRAHLMGLDAPVQVEAVIELSEAEHSLHDLLQAAQEREDAKEALLLAGSDFT